MIRLFSANDKWDYECMFDTVCFFEVQFMVYLDCNDCIYVCRNVAMNVQGGE